jgi:hypothetical protein
MITLRPSARFILSARISIHRSLGTAGAALAAVMIVLGPATALVVDETRFMATGRTPEFLAVQLADIVAFAGLRGAGLLLRKRAAAHKRLCCLAPFISAMPDLPDF